MIDIARVYSVHEQYLVCARSGRASYGSLLCRPLTVVQPGFKLPSAYPERPGPSTEEPVSLGQTNREQVIA